MTTARFTDRWAHPGRRRSLDAIVAAGLATLALVACGGDDPEAAVTSSSIDATVVVVSTEPVDGESNTSDAPRNSATSGGSDGEPSAATTIHEVPENTVDIRPPIDLDATGDFGTGVTVEVLGLEAIEGEARLPGEIAGPALRVEIRLTNDTDSELDLAGARIDITYGSDRTPGITLGQPDVVRLPASLEPGGQAIAASVFAVPLDQRDRVQVAVWYTVDAPIVVFEGAAPAA